MRGTVLVAALAALAALCAAAPSGDEAEVASSVSTYPQGPCEPGSEVSYQCNTCTCTQDGTGFACTRQLCPPRDRRDADCEPGRSYQAPDGCNTCVCSNTRQLACTQKLCLKPSKN